MSKGIDYGLGQTNVDKATGIRYGVIPHVAVGQAWYESSEAYYGDPTCPKCGNESCVHELGDEPETNEYHDDELIDLDSYEHAKYECDDYVCLACKYVFGSESAYGDEPISYYIDDGEYSAESGHDSADIFVMKSPYYTRAQYCSPCAPGACYLTNPCDDGDKAYCFGPDWFDDDSPCPYPVYRVDNDECIYRPAIAE